MNQISAINVVIQCDGCRRKLSVPDKPGFVTCPLCRHRWMRAPSVQAVAAQKAAAPPARYQPRAQAATLPSILLAIDATFSRRAAWGVQQEITDGIFDAVPGGIQLAVAAHSGGEVVLFTDYVTEYSNLRHQLGQVQCKGGETRIVPIMQRACGTPGLKVSCYIGDASEEPVDEAVAVARDMRGFGCRVVILYERNQHLSTDHAYSEHFFHAVAQAGGGIVLPFNSKAPAAMRDYMAALGAYAAGGSKLVRLKQATLKAAPDILRLTDD